MEAAGKRFIWHKSREDAFRIWNLSDLHLLSASCAYSEIARDIKEILEDPFSFWIGGGDWAEFIGPSDFKRWDPMAVDASLTVADLSQLGQVSANRARDLLKPIAHKCLGFGLGNHDEKYQMQMSQRNLHGWLCSELGVPSLEYCALFDLVFCRTSKVQAPTLKPAVAQQSTTQTFRCFFHHGAGGAQTKGGKVNRLAKFMQDFEADLYFVGHVHDKTGTRIQRIGANADCSKLIARDKVGVISGSYLRTYQQGLTGYGERKGYSPTTLGSAWAGVKPDGRELWGQI